MARTTRSSEQVSLATAQNQLAQSLDAINAADQKLESLLGFSAVIIALLFANVAATHHLWALWVARGCFVAAAAVAVYGIIIGQPTFGPVPQQASAVGEWERGYAINLYLLTGKLRAMQIASVTLFVGLLAITLAIV